MYFLALFSVLLKGRQSLQKGKIFYFSQRGINKTPVGKRGIGKGVRNEVAVRQDGEKPCLLCR